MSARAPLRFQSVEFSEGSICERGADNRHLVHVRRDDIQDLRVEYGMLAERPYLQGIVGGLLFVGGLYVVGHMFYYGLYLGRFVVAPAVGAVIGGWILQGVVTRGTYLRVQTRDAVRKLIFKGKVPPGALESFLAEVRAELGYEVSIGDPGRE